MGVSPSGVDNTHRQKILQQLEKDMFYLFQIWNKSLSVHTLIYDMKRNILYEDSDIDVKILAEGEISEFLLDAKKKVQKRIDKKYTSKIYSRKTQKKKGKLDFSEYECYPFYGLKDPFDLGGEEWLC